MFKLFVFLLSGTIGLREASRAMLAQRTSPNYRRTEWYQFDPNPKPTSEDASQISKSSLCTADGKFE